MNGERFTSSRKFDSRTWHHGVLLLGGSDASDAHIDFPGVLVGGASRPAVRKD